jgi:pimeloyl-ACP methyl ester carboxylesterase
MHQPTLKRIKTSDTHLQLAIWEGQLTPVLAVHGLTANCRCWDQIAATLSKKHGVITYDLRGRGDSGKPSKGYSIDIHCEDILGLLKKLKVKKINLMGHSLGASIALAFAAKHPKMVEHLILIDGASKLNKKQIKKILISIKPAITRLGKIYPSFNHYLNLVKKAPYFNPWNRALEIYFHHDMKKIKGGVTCKISPDHIKEEMGNMAQFDPSSFYKKIEAPTLIIAASKGMTDRDDILLPKTALKKMVGDIQNCWVMDIKDANHYSIIFSKNSMRDKAILNFLSS